MLTKIALSILLCMQSLANANYCNYDGCSGVPMGCCSEEDLQYCNANDDQCEGRCEGQWCTDSFSYCTWSTCDGIIRSTQFCNSDQNACEGACGGMWCTNGGTSSGGGGGGGGAPSPSTPITPLAPAPVPTALAPAPFTSTAGKATTTRYWDCSGGSCGCAYLPFGPGTDSQPSHCHSNAMFAAPTGNSYGATFYGTAAVSQELFGYGTSWLGTGCGRCYKLTGTSNIAETPDATTTVVLKAANLCPPENPMCAGNNIHFDIAVPGFDYTASSFAHVCPSREANESAGFSACEFWMIKSQNPNENCDCSAFNSPTLKAGCENFLSLNWNNPTVEFEAVECPFELDRLSCWEENGNKYPFGIPDFCESNTDSSPSNPQADPSPEPAPTDAPVTPLTNAPVALPTNAPVPSPTNAPVTPLTNAPVVLPTNAPVPSPTNAPVTPPTNAPSPNPTNAPVPPPTNSPLPLPSNAPVLPPTGASVPSPTNASVGSSGSFCCSTNYVDCNVQGWCGANQSRCEGDCSAKWIEVGSCNDGIPRWGECTENEAGCCAPATCQGGPYHKQCK